MNQKLNLKTFDLIRKSLKFSNWTLLTLFYSCNLASVVSSPKARDLIDSVSQLIVFAKEEKIVPLVIVGSREWSLFKDPNGKFVDIGKQMVGCKKNREAFVKMFKNSKNEKPMALIVGKSIIKAKTEILGDHFFHHPQLEDANLHIDFYALAIRKDLGWKRVFDVV